jgi:hypothetical protein
MSGAYPLCVTDMGVISGAYMICATHIPDSGQASRAQVGPTYGAYFLICATNRENISGAYNKLDPYARLAAPFQNYTFLFSKHE